MWGLFRYRGMSYVCGDVCMFLDRLDRGWGCCVFCEYQVLVLVLIVI